MLNSMLKYLIVLVVFLVLDFIWLVLVAKKPYRKYLGFLMREKPDFISAFVFYIIFIIGLMVFVIAPALGKGSVSDAILRGALFGLVTYSTYDLTNQATIKGWPSKITIIDLLWGTCVSAMTALLGFLIIQVIW